MLAHKEIELKFPLTESEYHDLLIRLSEKYVSVCLHQNDFVIKTKTGENVRVRREDGRALLTHKKKIYAPDGTFLYCQESESLIDEDHSHNITGIMHGLGLMNIPQDVCLDVDIFQKWLENALTSQMAYSVHIHKNRTEFKDGDYTYVVDKVEGLGYFLEIELLASLDDTTKEVELRDQMSSQLNVLGLSYRNNVLHGYSVLMHEKDTKCA